MFSMLTTFMFTGIPGAVGLKKQESIIQKKIAHYSLKFLEEEFGEDGLKNEHLKNLHQRLNTDLRFFNQEIEEMTDSGSNSLKKFQSIYLQMLDRQPKLLDEMNHKAEFDEELIRKYLGLIDIEEFKMREKILKE